MSTTPTLFAVVTAKLNAAQNAGKAGAGTANSDGSVNTFGTVLGAAFAMPLGHRKIGESYVK